MSEWSPNDQSGVEYVRGKKVSGEGGVVCGGLWAICFLTKRQSERGSESVEL